MDPALCHGLPARVCPPPLLAAIALSLPSLTDLLEGRVRNETFLPILLSLLVAPPTLSLRTVVASLLLALPLALGHAGEGDVKLVLLSPLFISERDFWYWALAFSGLLLVSRIFTRRQAPPIAMCASAQIVFWVSFILCSC